MYYKELVLICLVLNIVIKVSSNDNECDLNLSQIFRTPKDFSRVNFDHFEILERNGFGEPSSEHPQNSVAQKELYGTPSSLPKSIANAQVMLRFGGDGLRGQNCLDHAQKLVTSPHCLSSLDRHYCKIPHHYHQRHDDVRYLPYPPLPHPMLPPVREYIPPIKLHSQPLSVFPPPVEPLFYPYPPPTPFAFPGCYYRMIPELLNYQRPEYLLPHMVKHSTDPHLHSREYNSQEERAFLELRDGRATNQDHPKILQTKDLSEDTIPEIKCTKNVAVTGKARMEETPEFGTREQKRVEDNLSNEIFKPLLPIPRPKLIVLENVENISICKNVSSNAMNDVDVDPLHKKNGSGNISNLETLLNNSLVPYFCAQCGNTTKMLVSYPITENQSKPKITVEQNPHESDECGCDHCEECYSCSNCEKKLFVPHGKRFPTDMDALLRSNPVVFSIPLKQLPTKKLNTWEHPPPCHQIYSTDHAVSPISSFTTGHSQINEEPPELYFNGYKSSSASGYYSDPTKSVYYQEPTVVHIVQTLPMTRSIKSQTPRTTPHIYAVIPKYNIVTKNITPLDIRDLTPTDPCVCPFCRCFKNNGISRRVRCPIHVPVLRHREHYKTDNIVSALKESNLPDQYGAPGYSNFFRYLLALKDIP